MTDVQKLAREEEARYHREWRRKNPEKVRAIKERYWAKKAAERRENDAADQNN